MMKWVLMKRTDKGMGSEIGDYGEGQVPGGWTPSLKDIKERKNTDLGTLKNSGYYNGNTARSVQDLITALEHPESMMTSTMSSSSLSRTSGWIRDLNKERIMEFTGKEGQDYLSPGKRMKTTPSSAWRAPRGW